jgi:hypothetical protein
MIPIITPPEKKFKDDLGVIWDLLKSVTFFLGIYLFFLGWTYLFFYFSKFGIAFSNISLDIVSYYNYGFFSLLRGNMFLIFSIFFTAFFIVYYRRNKLRNSYITIFVLIFLFFIFSYFVTKYNAECKVLKIVNRQERLNPIYFDFTKEFIVSMAKDSGELKLMKIKDSILDRSGGLTSGVKLLIYNNSQQLYQIYENADNYYVIFNPSVHNASTSNIELYNILKKNTNYAKKIMLYEK